VDQEAMVEEIRDLKTQITTSRMDTTPVKNLDPSKFILQIPDITENYKQHFDFGKVKVLSSLEPQYVGEQRENSQAARKGGSH
jgi:hypothetical protein